MIETIYIEDNIQKHEECAAIIDRLRPKNIIPINHYGEIFNRKKQNFRLQKRNPALILAEKKNKFVLPAPSGYGVASGENYYFSHMLNCLYDCRYCFLQGMYSSAHYLLFVNYNDFMRDIENTIAAKNSTAMTFFTGYDCDSLALEDVTHFAERFLPFFAKYPEHLFELRTKSINIKHLLAHPPIKNVIVAFSLNPEPVAKALEHKAPNAAQRLAAMQKLANHGWSIGLRFDPLIDHLGFEDNYGGYIQQIKTTLPADAVHSVSIGPVRFPSSMYNAIVKLYPEEKLLACGLEKRDKLISYSAQRERALVDFVRKQLEDWLDSEKFFTCMPEAA